MTTKRIYTRKERQRFWSAAEIGKKRTEPNRMGAFKWFRTKIRYWNKTENKCDFVLHLHNEHEPKHPEKRRECGRHSHTSRTRYWKLNFVQDDESIQNNTEIRYAFDINIIRWYLRGGCLCVYTKSSSDILSISLAVDTFCCLSALLVTPKMFARCRHSSNTLDWRMFCKLPIEYTKC